jgi:hypothetical protein
MVVVVMKVMVLAAPVLTINNRRLILEDVSFAAVVRAAKHRQAVFGVGRAFVVGCLARASLLDRRRVE